MIKMFKYFRHILEFWREYDNAEILSVYLKPNLSSVKGLTTERLITVTTGV